MEINQVDQQPEPTKKCGTCQREIEQSKFRMHEIGCARNNYKCTTCGEIVAKVEKDEHEKEAHVLVKCQYCGQEANKKQNEMHEPSCYMQPQPCKYCEQIVKFTDMERHLDYCGSKTKKCQTCNRNICFKDWENHESRNECQKFIEEDRLKKEQEVKRKQEEEKRQLLEEKKRQEEEKRRREEKKKRDEENYRLFSQNIDIDEWDEGLHVNQKMPQNQINSGTGKTKLQPQAFAVKAMQGAQVQKPGVQIQKNSTNGTYQQKNQAPKVGQQSMKQDMLEKANQYSNKGFVNAPSINLSYGKNQQTSKVVQPPVSQNKPSSYQGQSSKEEQKAGSINQKVQPKTTLKPQQLPLNKPSANQASSKPSGYSNSQQQKAVPQGGVQKQQLPSKQTTLQKNMPPKFDVGEDDEVVARILEEQESLALAEKLQNQFYQGSNDDVPVMHSNQSNQQRYNPPPQYSQLIGGAYDEHAGYDDFGIPGEYANMGRQFPNGDPMNSTFSDENFQKAIEESLRLKGTRNQEEEELRRALEQSLQHK